MPAPLSLTQFAERCLAEENLGALWQLAVQFYNSRGIEMISYHLDRDRRENRRLSGVIASGFPEDWVCHYIEADLVKIDPIPDLALKRARPFRWSETPDLVQLTDDQKDYMRQLEAAGLGDGLAMQVSGPNLRNAYIALGFSNAEEQFDAWQVFELQCAAQIAHSRYCDLTTDEHEDIADLSPREREVLDWIAQGKSNSVIADILGVSAHTIDTLTRRIFAKLGVNDRITAAIKGIGSGLLKPHPAPHV